MHYRNLNMPENEFEKQLEELINKHSKENDSNTPDWILADYISKCLKAFNETVNAREKWHGRTATESSTTL